MSQGCDLEWAQAANARFGLSIGDGDAFPAGAEALAPSVVPRSWLNATRMAMEGLGCTRNSDAATPQHCLAYQQTLPSNLIGVPELNPGRVPMEERCRWWRDAGCCAPLLVEVAFGAATTLHGGALNNRSVEVSRECLEAGAWGETACLPSLIQRGFSANYSSLARLRCKGYHAPDRRTSTP